MSYVLRVMLYYFVFFFFFQAEDGIRDGTVTGVQTCALPISYRKLVRCRTASPSTTYKFTIGSNEMLISKNLETSLVFNGGTRSEERRVGKECRSQWWP